MQLKSPVIPTIQIANILVYFLSYVFLFVYKNYIHIKHSHQIWNHIGNTFFFFFGNTLKAFLRTAVISDICRYTQAVRLVLKAVQFGVNILFLDF